MQFLKQGPLNAIEYREGALEAVRKLNNLDQQRINEAIDILHAWVQKQDHFTRKDFSREFYDRIITVHKGKLERAKQKLDKICTIRTLMPHYFDPKIIRELKELDNDDIYDAIMPIQTDEYYRILINEFAPKKFTKDTIINYCRRCVVYTEFLVKYDYNAGLVCIVDLRKTNMKELVFHLTLHQIKEMATIWLDGYAMHVKQIHVVTDSKLLDGLVAMFKQFLSEKLASRIYTHTSIDTLFDYVPKNLLPEEYGGKMGPFSELHRKLLEVVTSDDFVDMETISQTKTDESKRNIYKFNEQHLGTPGSFRTLVVD